jgi:microsomal epoxide hydrolase
MSNHTDIAPFTIAIPEADLEDLRERLRRTRWPQELSDAGWDYGMPVAYLRELVEYWQDGYDWRAQEAQINAVPNFTTTIDGQRIHFIHVRTEAPDAPPLILTHGWPGSVVEFMPMIDPLTTAGFDLVIPSLPGFGLSGPTTERGWNPARIARAWAALMQRLGYERYLAHGGDFGSGVSRELALLQPENVIGVHLTELAHATPDPHNAREDDEAEQAAVAARQRYHYDLSGYMWVQTQRPQTLAVGLADSPAFQLAWIAERFRDWTAGQTPDDKIDRDLLLTNVMLYWLTDTAASSSRIYHEDAANYGQDDRTGTVPTGIADTPANIGHPVRRIAEQTETSSTGPNCPPAATSPDSRSPTSSPQTSPPSPPSSNRPRSGPAAAERSGRGRASLNEQHPRPSRFPFTEQRKSPEPLSRRSSLPLSDTRSPDGVRLVPLLERKRVSTDAWVAHLQIANSAHRCLLARCKQSHRCRSLGQPGSRARNHET